MPPFYKQSELSKRQSICGFYHKWECKCAKNKKQFEKNEKIRLALKQGGKEYGRAIRKLGEK